MKTLAIIPARGGSKRIPNKNVKIFHDKPIIGYTIEAALKSQLFDKIIVSTDSKKIADVSKEFGAEVPFFRSEKNSDDYATTADVLLEVIEKLEDQGEFYDYICCLYACAPFITTESLSLSFSKIKNENFDSVFPITEYSFPIQRAVKINSTLKVEMFQPQFMQTRSQDLESSYHDVGQFYFIKKDIFLVKRTLWTDNTGCIILPEIQSQDIDTLEDWKLAELKYKILNK